MYLYLGSFPKEFEAAYPEKTYPIMLTKCELSGEKSKTNETGRKGEHIAVSIKFDS